MVLHLTLLKNMLAIEIFQDFSRAYLFFFFSFNVQTLFEMNVKQVIFTMRYCNFLFKIELFCINICFKLIRRRLSHLHLRDGHDKTF